jgi:hypothetical protein
MAPAHVVERMGVNGNVAGPGSVLRLHSHLLDDGESVPAGSARLRNHCIRPWGKVPDGSGAAIISHAPLRIVSDYLVARAVMPASLSLAWQPTGLVACRAVGKTGRVAWTEAYALLVRSVQCASDMKALRRNTPDLLRLGPTRVS